MQSLAGAGDSGVGEWSVASDKVFEKGLGEGRETASECEGETVVDVG